MMPSRLVLPIAILLAGTSCTSKVKPPAVAAATVPNGAPSVPRDYVDVEAGWRLRVIAPVTKSGAYEAVETVKSPQSQGNVISLKASGDLIGYETALWTVSVRRGGGVSIRLFSAELTKDGQAAPITAPTRAAIHVPNYARFIRIFYLTRKSDADHNMALAGVSRADQLETFTRTLREAPNDACSNRPREHIYCEWIPVGMAVRPEIPKIVDGVTRWGDRF
jgi:hypothetical protein